MEWTPARLATEVAESVETGSVYQPYHHPLPRFLLILNDSKSNDLQVFLLKGLQSRVARAWWRLVVRLRKGHDSSCPYRKRRAKRIALQK